MRATPPTTPWVQWLQARPSLVAGLGAALLSAALITLAAYVGGVDEKVSPITGPVLAVFFIGLLFQHFALAIWLGRIGHRGWAWAIYLLPLYADVAYFVYCFVNRRKSQGVGQRPIT